MLNINSISKGIVIDHIKPGYGFFIFKHLKLDEANFTVALIMNATSKKHGRKDMIKIENVIDIDLAMLGFIDPNITVNIIEDEKITEKITLSLPDKVEGIIECKNPRCITSNERGIVHKFVLINEEKGTYKCEYCDQIYSWEG
ncbi:aspartate carbamoyltransferase regulatory subunit [Tissierella praeacuta]|uniref:Aspartate carbamoyltransferase regulatory subunit n=1 Tax=Tissierella praeacuta DSM 18095 TaxID=1123404 RepID=A0A1M4V8T1_9FIRM|nr:aspartate carbamoyltransferase regulatory subunit [Tissierella praeacuta]HAE92325.1 aspartate carbamoyltransferase regulatory subunit [Tissierella sp.]MBU5255009.1 aspartate carbamoyltransferase regulatory subunit [Tissierella praeacuta]TCU74142.1 aspartate carbamoyltransferase regulatory subunit [Tissierella praeacuta]SHE65406.1 aspartate carbamoyltransferase regulatory subunit [Tissierella praeacuta DSM 18095]SUP03044.1 Aspartate carbamoyltransferase regulatory chain [Tissierella praeacut